MIIFAEKNKELREMFKKEFPDIEVAEDMFAVPEPKNVVTCSNKWLSMGGGIDALIAKHYPDECRDAKDFIKDKGFISPFTFGKVVFALTVDDQLKADTEEIGKILSYIFKHFICRNEVYVFTGMGTGIGGLSNESFIKLCKEANQ